MGDVHCINTEAKPILLDNHICLLTEDSINIIDLSTNELKDFALFNSLKQAATSKGMLKNYLKNTGYYRFDLGIGQHDDTLLISCGTQGQYYIWGINKESLAFEITVDKNLVGVGDTKEKHTTVNAVKGIILPIYSTQ